MSYYGSGGMFGSGYDNPQYGYNPSSYGFYGSNDPSGQSNAASAQLRAACQNGDMNACMQLQNMSTQNWGMMQGQQQMDFNQFMQMQQWQNLLQQQQNNPFGIPQGSQQDEMLGWQNKLWQQQLSQMPWHERQQYGPNAPFMGYGDWRNPNPPGAPYHAQFGYGTIGFNMMNPSTGQTMFRLDRQSPTWTNMQFDPTAFGGWGQGPWNGPNGNWGEGGGWQPTPYNGPNYQPGEKWGGGGIEPPTSTTSSEEVINSSIPLLEEQRRLGFADAANRFGSSGMVGSPYMRALGDVERRSAQDLDRIVADYRYRAAESQAQRALEAQQNQYNRDLSAWQTYGGWGHEGQMGDLQRDFNAWQSYQQLGLGGAQLDLDAWMAQNGWNLQSYLAQQNMMQGLLGNMFGPSYSFDF